MVDLDNSGARGRALEAGFRMGGILDDSDCSPWVK